MDQLPSGQLLLSGSTCQKSGSPKPRPPPIRITSPIENAYGIQGRGPLGVDPAVVDTFSPQHLGPRSYWRANYGHQEETGESTPTSPFTDNECLSPNPSTSSWSSVHSPSTSISSFENLGVDHLSLGSPHSLRDQHCPADGSEENPISLFNPVDSMKVQGSERRWGTPYTRDTTSSREGGQLGEGVYSPLLQTMDVTSNAVDSASGSGTADSDVLFDWLLDDPYDSEPSSFPFPNHALSFISSPAHDPSSYSSFHGNLTHSTPTSGQASISTHGHLNAAYLEQAVSTPSTVQTASRQTGSHHNSDRSVRPISSNQLSVPPSNLYGASKHPAVRPGHRSPKIQLTGLPATLSTLPNPPLPSARRRSISKCPSQIPDLRANGSYRLTTEYPQGMSAVVDSGPPNAATSYTQNTFNAQALFPPLPNPIGGLRHPQFSAPAPPILSDYQNTSTYGHLVESSHHEATTHGQTPSTLATSHAAISGYHPGESSSFGPLLPAHPNTNYKQEQQTPYYAPFSTSGDDMWVCLENGIPHQGKLEAYAPQDQMTAAQTVALLPPSTSHLDLLTRRDDTGQRLRARCCERARQMKTTAEQHIFEDGKARDWKFVVQ